jgi:prepilin-type N-terminal cleavage/methylation domain-containing protein
MTKKHGLTLVELLVTLAIMVLLLMVGVVGFRTSQKKHELKDSALEIKDIIDRTRQYALAPRNGVSNKIYGYCVQFTGGNGGRWWINEYATSSDSDVSPVTDTLDQCLDSGTDLTKIEEGKMPSYINIGNLTAIGFATARWGEAPVIYGGAGQTDEDYSFTVKHTKTSEVKTISVTKNGITNVAQ